MDDETKQKEIEEEGAVGDTPKLEEFFEGIGVEVVTTPKGRAKRVRALSEGSPEQELRRRRLDRGGVAHKMDMCTKKVQSAVQEIKRYVGKNFSKEKHEGFFIGCFDKITNAQKELVEDVARVSVMLDRMILVEDRLKDLAVNEEGEFNRRLELIEERMTRQVREENRQALDKARAEVERCRVMLESEDAQRQNDLEEIGKDVSTRLKELEGKIEKEFKKIRDEQVERIERDLKKIAEEQKKGMEGLLKGLASMEKRVADGNVIVIKRMEGMEGKHEIVSKFLDNVKNNMELLYERMQLMQHAVEEKGINVEMGEIKETMSVVC